MIATVAAAAGGLVLLIVGSGRFVAGAAGLSLRFRVPPVVIGAVVVGFGTSAPELLASTLAAAAGSHDIAFGNVVGSNIANLTLVLGAVALVARPVIASGVLRREVPVMVAAMISLTVVLPRLGRAVGIVLLVLFAAAMAVMLRITSGQEADQLGEETERELHRHAPRSMVNLTALTLGGLVATVLGAHLLVSGARSLADVLHLGEGLVGFTLVAVGSSLPEMVTGIQAARRGEPDLAIGNVLGSNVFNSLAVAGVATVVSPGAVSVGLTRASWVMLGTGAIVWLLMWTARRLERWESVALLAVYAATIPIVA